MVFVRKAVVEDLPVIHDLIRDSFDAMTPHSWFSARFWKEQAESLISQELLPGKFEDLYLNSSNHNFWVAVNEADSKVVGCVGIKPGKSEKILELVRMG